jgi:tight adherence protein B
VQNTSWNPINWYDRLIVESGFPISSPVTLLILCLMSLSAGLACEWYFEMLPATLAAAAVVVVLPIPVFMFFRSRRRRILLLQLPEIFELLARALRAGRSLPDAIALAADVAPSPCNAEFYRCHKQLNMGLSFAIAAQNLARRINLFDMDLFLTTVLVHHGGGGNLPEALDRLSAMSRDRQHFRGHLMAVTAQQRLSTIMLLFLAPVVVAALVYINPNYLSMLLTTSLGHKMLAVAAVLQIVGLVWVSRLLRVQY